MFKSTKSKAITTTIAAVLIFTFLILNYCPAIPADQIKYGVTFSQKQAKALGLDWQGLFNQIIDNLGVRQLRLVAYWDDIESEQGRYNWEELDWLINQAASRDAQVILAVGGRLPRWPECYWPQWSKGMTDHDREREILAFIQAAILRYRDNKAIQAWQIENEPFLPFFGECPVIDPDLLDKEIMAARLLDTRPIVVTDSGELSIWWPAASRADIFGTTMYRDTYSEKLKRYVHYPIGPWFFRMKRNIVRQFAHPQEWIVIELQAEPWGPRPYQDMSAEERGRTMDLEKFRDMLDFARRTGFSRYYLWGVEWWAWERDKQNNPALWDEAKLLFNAKGN